MFYLIVITIKAIEKLEGKWYKNNLTKMHDTLLCCYIFYFSQIEILKNILIKN